jgi:uncharacterized protein (DUF2235 family)
MEKNIVIFSDGTGQIGGSEHNTNVYKLFNMVEDRTAHQVVYYDPGLGTDRRKVSGNIFGRGFSRNMLDCYRFLFENYNAGDKVFLFGFSRGAATVRSLSGFVHRFGILPQSRRDLIERAFGIYKIKNRERRIKEAEAFISKNHTMWCKIKFLGVFDTVAALGIQNGLLGNILDRLFPYRFHSFELSESVEFARHALSIDDERKLFAPVLWDALKDENKDMRMKQVWFCGVHTDVGGGYAEDDLSNIPLRWMIKEASQKGLRIYEESAAYQSLLAAKVNADGIMHNEQKGWKARLFSRKQRAWNEETHGPPLIHSSVFKRALNNANAEDPKYAPWLSNCKNSITED